MVLVLRGKLVRLIQTRVKFVFIMWLKLTTTSCPNGRSPLFRRIMSAHPRGPPLWLIISRPIVLGEIIESSGGPRHLSTIPLKNFHLFKIAKSVINFCLKKFSN